ncbi:ABC transporter ATP-binding protein [Terrihabitans rhizophilus]|uniref:ABC transporter ATP-binding protein n=1 Tax=Terrihabitans rhizophilus TaxID=3092662 RepID=A0ABU4RJ37_9HYPH|nr:ABC transporter ATP-binding protein [Terrihabitans sp. PJ23]MDX6804837.1 ABC transporter ATP-binding protein [Terrihabitans sp. PJ23]
MTAAVRLPAPAQEAASVLALESIDKTYEGADKPALDRVSFQVAPGEFFSLLGPSGSGKTTILRMIAGFETPDRGRVLMDGHSVNHVPPNRRDVRTVFQSYALFPHLTVRDNVQYSLKVGGTPRAERDRLSADALAMVDMSPYADRLPHQLSGGQRQRIALARAIVCRPRILLLDEPLGALDLRLRQQMQHTLVALQKELGIAFVYVTHDQSEALSMSNRVAIMRNGRIAQLGTPQDLYFAPASEFVAGFVGRSNLIPLQFVKTGGIAIADVLGVPAPELTDSREGAARMALRFEAVRLETLSEQTAPGPTGVIEDVLFLGTNFEVNVRCGDLNIIASVPATKDQHFAVGQKVRVVLDLSHARIFRD